MNPLLSPTKEELAQELLAFKHLVGIAPILIDDVNFKVQLLSMKVGFYEQMFDSYRQRKRINHDRYLNNLQVLLHQLKLPQPIDSQECREEIINTRNLRKDRLRDEIQELEEMKALDRAREENIANKMGEIKKHIAYCVDRELFIFQKLKEKEGKAFRYFNVSEEELQKAAEKRFEKVIEIIRYIQEENQAEKI